MNKEKEYKLFSKVFFLKKFMGEEINIRVKKITDFNKKKKILCRNSYESDLFHKLAREEGVSHRSIIDYTQIHINQGQLYFRDTNYDIDDKEYECILSAIPHTFVELNSGYENLIIGCKEMIPENRKIIIQDGFAKNWYINREKSKLKLKHENNVKKYNMGY